MYIKEWEWGWSDLSPTLITKYTHFCMQFIVEYLLITRFKSLERNKWLDFSVKDKSLLNKIKNGPRLSPWGTPEVAKKALDSKLTCMKYTVYIMKSTIGKDWKRYRLNSNNGVIKSTSIMNSLYLYLHKKFTLRYQQGRLIPKMIVLCRISSMLIPSYRPIRNSDLSFFPFFLL